MDLSAQKPELRQQLIGAWDEYARSVGVIAAEGDPLSKN